MKIHAFVFALVMSTWSAPVVAFGTVNALLGQAIEHEKITRAALSFVDPNTLDQIAGTSGTFGAVGAPDRPFRGLASDPKAHCDNGDSMSATDYPQQATEAKAALLACRDHILGHFEKAVTLARDLVDPSPDKMNLSFSAGMNRKAGCPFDGVSGSLKCRVIEELGLAFHASQDFYSHTNWSDVADSAAPTSVKNPEGLERAEPAPFIDPTALGEFPSGLVSGCFESWFEGLNVGCKLGGIGPFGGKPRIRHHDINKDRGSIGPVVLRAVGLAGWRVDGALGPGKTPRGRINKNFEAAVRLAIIDTRLKWVEFEKRLAAEYGDAKGKRIACLIRSDDAAKCPDLWEAQLRICGDIREKSRERYRRIADIICQPTGQDMERRDAEIAQLLTGPFDAETERWRRDSAVKTMSCSGCMSEDGQWRMCAAAVRLNIEYGDPIPEVLRDARFPRCRERFTRCGYVPRGVIDPGDEGRVYLGTVWQRPC